MNMFGLYVMLTKVIDLLASYFVTINAAYLIILRMTLFCNNPGKSWMDKVEQIRGDLVKKNAFAVVVAALDEVACE